MKRRFSRGDDTGSALLFAVIVVFVVMLVVTSMLTLSSGNMRATAAYKDQASTTGAAEGAAQVAANSIRRGATIAASGLWNGFNNSVGQHCFPGSGGSLITGGSDTLQLDDVAVQGNQHYSAAVTCAHSGGSSSPVIINAANRPGLAILTTGTGALAGEEGLSIKALSSYPFIVHGPIYSNSNIDMVSGSLQDPNGVYAKGACIGAGSITPAKICNYSGATPSGADPGYAPDKPTVLPADYPYQGSAQVSSPAATLPFDQTFPNSCKTKVIVFQPGYYDDAQALSTMMMNSGCKDSTFWFKPGSYYFDFHNGDDPTLPAGSHVWTVATGALVAGTPMNGGAVLTQPPLSPSVPGSCRSPITSPLAGQGVQFVFGGDSQLVVDAAKVEICGSYSLAKPPIAIYGAVSGAETQETPTGLHLTLGSGSGNFSNPDNTQIAGDGQVATWIKTTSNSQTGTSILSGFLPPSNIPTPGTHLDAALLKVVHSNTASVTADKRKVLIGLPDGTTITVSLNDRVGSGQFTDTIDLAANATFAKLVHDKGLTGPLTITYSATVGHAGTEAIDAVTLDMKYRLPAYRGQDSVVLGGNCLTLPFTGGGGSGCAALTSTQAPSSQFFIQGTAYAPKSAFDISLNQSTSQVFKFGVVARSLQVKVTGSGGSGQPVIEIPDDAPGSVISTNIVLSVYVCPTTSGCVASGTPALRTRMALIDPDPGAVLESLRALNIQSWSTPMRSGG